ncbi:MAG: hypothetical protein U5L09_12205 [Bacteroidales bacterium]|nr:hypothetical protein [Bacteroidales bacterium]
MMQNVTKQFVWVMLFALSMAFFETSVVVYLREIYYPTGFSFPLQSIEYDIAVTEILREAFSLLMIVSVAIIAGKTALQRFGYFLLVFAVWDIFYYVFLKMLLNWPESFLTYDVLFLIPVTWTGPVIAPILNSVMMLVLGYILVTAANLNQKAVIRPASWVLLIGGALVVLIAYMKDFVSYMDESFTLWQVFLQQNNPQVLERASSFVPDSFSWILFLAGVLMHAVAIFLTARHNFKNGG